MVKVEVFDLDYNLGTNTTTDNGLKVSDVYSFIESILKKCYKRSRITNKNYSNLIDNFEIRWNDESDLYLFYYAFNRREWMSQKDDNGVIVGWHPPSDVNIKFDKVECNSLYSLFNVVLNYSLNGLNKKGFDEEVLKFKKKLSSLNIKSLSKELELLYEKHNYNRKQKSSFIDKVFSKA